MFGEVGSVGTLAAQPLGSILTAASDWTEMWGALAFSIGAVMIYGALYQARLVPRWLSGWGFVGGVLYFIAYLVSIFNPLHAAPSIGLGIGLLLVPLAIQEMVFAVWLIVKGFNPSTTTSLSAKTATNERLSAT
jgi:uncharacterized membrane protein HdeD (DUF308 family)